MQKGLRSKDKQITKKQQVAETLKRNEKVSARHLNIIEDRIDDIIVARDALN